MELASFIASTIAVLCIALEVLICIFMAMGNVDELIENADEWEGGE